MKTEADRDRVRDQGLWAVLIAFCLLVAGLVWATWVTSGGGL